MTACAIDPQGRLSGTLTFDNLACIRAAGEAIINAGTAGRIIFDLSGLKETNSATAALLIAWRRAAGNAGKTLCFTQAPEHLQNLIAFSGLGDILPIGKG